MSTKECIKKIDYSMRNKTYRAPIDTTLSIKINGIFLEWDFIDRVIIKLT